MKDCPDGSKVPESDSCPTYSWWGRCNIGGGSGGSGGYSTPAAAGKAASDFVAACPSSDLSSSTTKHTNYYAHITCNDGTKFTVGPASTLTAIRNLAQGGLLACSVSGFSDHAGKTLSSAQLREVLRTALEDSSAPTNVDDLFPDEGASGTQGAAQDDAGFTTFVREDKHYTTVTCDDGTSLTIGPEDTMREAVINSLFGILVCSNRDILTGPTMPADGAEVTRAQLENAARAIVAALPTPVALEDLSMERTPPRQSEGPTGQGEGASGEDDGATGQSGTYTISSSSWWTWSASCTGANGQATSSSGTATSASDAASAILNFALGCSAGGGSSGVSKE